MSDSRIQQNPRGSGKELSERIFDNTEHIINMMKLDRNSVLDVPKDGSELVGDERRMTRSHAQSANQVMRLQRIR